MVSSRHISERPDPTTPLGTRDDRASLRVGAIEHKLYDGAPWDLPLLWLSAADSCLEMARKVTDETPGQKT